MLTVFETIFWNSVNILKTMNLNGAFCRYFIRYFEMQRQFWKQRSSIVHSDAFWDLCSTNFRQRVPPGSTSVTTPSIFIANLDVLFFSLIWMKCRPGPIGATPVYSSFSRYFVLVGLSKSIGLHLFYCCTPEETSWSPSHCLV